MRAYYKSRPVYAEQTKGRVSARHKERRELIQWFKGVPCADCKQKFDPICMDFDHVRGDKVKDVSLMIDWNLNKLLAEIDKCDVVCANCHRLRTYVREHRGRR